MQVTFTVLHMDPHGPHHGTYTLVMASSGKDLQDIFEEQCAGFHSDCHTEDKMHTPRSFNTPHLTHSASLSARVHSCLHVFFLILYSPSLSLYIGFIHAQCGKLCKYQSIKIHHFQSHHLPHVLSAVLFFSPRLSENVFILPARRLSLL